MLANKTLMITGGTGSFGSTVVSRFIKTDLKQIIIFSRDEKKQEDMRLKLRSKKVKFVIGDVRDPVSVNQAMQGVDFVFHAAALKQVPSCEFYPMEAFRTNVIGSENVIDAAIKNKIEKLVLLSTDKAVYPINAMGMSKAMAEKVMIAKARALGDLNKPILCATRYGNIMASRGSVIPVFIDQVRQGKPLLITNPNMTRFLMTLEESVDLVLYAFENANQGDIFVQKAPACTISNLAEAVSQIFGSPLVTKVLGTRHGEKLFETLVSREEMVKAIDVNNFWRVPADNRDLNYELYISEGSIELNDLDDYTSHNTTRLTVDQIIEKLLNLPYVQKCLKNL